MKRFAFLCAASAVIAGSGFAQDAKPVGVTLRLGQFLPQGRAARDAGAKWTAAGVDFNLKTLGRSNGERRSLSVSIDYANKTDFSTIPLCINYVTAKDEFYWFFGAGVAYVELPRPNGSVIEQDSSVEAAYQFGFGYSPQKGKSPLFVELKYAGNGEDRLSGVMFSVGIRL